MADSPDSPAEKKQPVRTYKPTKPRKPPVPKGPPKRRVKTQPSKHPWDQIRDHYMTAESSVTMKELAEVYGINYDVVRAKGAEERWTYLRAEYQTKNRIAIQEARTQTLVKEAVSFDDVSLKAAKLGQTLIVGRLGQIAQLFQASGVSFDKVLAKVRAGQPVDLTELRSSINYKELVELANALDRFQNVGRKALGTDVEKIDLSVIQGSIVEVNISEELGKPDLDRMAATVEAMRRAGLESLFGATLELEAGEDDGEEDAAEDGPGDGSEDAGVDGGPDEVLEGEIVG